jgi:diguanylate cyclase (GGDEF)-like protein
MVTSAAQPSNSSNQTTFSTRVHGFPAENELKDLRFQLTHNLQATLDLFVAIDLFFKNIQAVVACDGITYMNKTMNIHHHLGSKTKHTANYTISSSANSLGEITFERAYPFLEPELSALEMFVGVLFYPLRNALLYREALESSLRDPLTGIGNRSAMDLNLGREIKLAKRQKQSLSLLVIDIDHFKNINDTFGHRNGDKALIHITKCIQSSLRETDQIFRYGGEEFVVLLNGTGMASAKLTAERIRMNVAMSPISVEFKDHLCTISIGISSLSTIDNVDTLFTRADLSLYNAKHNGRNKVVCSIGDENNEIKKTPTHERKKA